MRLLAGFLALSGAVWMVGLVSLDALDGGPQAWTPTLAVAAVGIVITGVAVTFLAETAAQVFRRLACLWLVCVVWIAFGSAASFGDALGAAIVAAVFVTIGFAAWLVFPLIAYSLVREGSRPGA